MKQGKLINRIMMLVLLAAVVVYLAASAWRSFRDPYTFVMSYAYTVDDSLEANELFLSRCTAFYDAGLYQADLATEQTRRAVNGWVEENTGGMIPEILTKVPAEDAALLLVNALYLKNTWADGFDPNSTREDSFYAADGTGTVTDFLSNGIRQEQYFRTADAAGVVLPTTTGGWAFSP